MEKYTIDKNGKVTFDDSLPCPRCRGVNRTKAILSEGYLLHCCGVGSFVSMHEKNNVDALSSWERFVESNRETKFEGRIVRLYKIIKMYEQQFGIKAHSISFEKLTDAEAQYKFTLDKIKTMDYLPDSAFKLHYYNNSGEEYQIGQFPHVFHIEGIDEEKD